VRWLARSDRPLGLPGPADRVDDCDYDLEEKFAAERPVSRKGLQDRGGVGESGGLDDDALERRHLAALALGNEPPQRHLQVAAGRAADAPVADQRDLVGGAADQHVVDPGCAIFIDHDRGAAPVRRSQEMPHQRGLAGAKKAGDHRHRQARPARALLPSAERSRLARWEEIEHRSTRPLAYRPSAPACSQACAGCGNLASRASTSWAQQSKMWMAGTRPAMTKMAYDISRRRRTRFKNPSPGCRGRR